ncbi:TerB N-terminal domain-containing protein [Microvirga sp. BT688]|uniref:TerB N-terminal domain-containing protein n=1 Tax=Microvirga sp. TaxID=1873136 RepID=UPI0016868FAD|nr:TerB N-terminal domain-containing protein [Microvirga sp.]MBD2747303.1 TerB N-terminal domain-containing protein [Microvirga sp.]
MVRLQGITLTSGLFYLGESLRSVAGPQENCLINPALAVAAVARPIPEEPDDRPSYENLPPVARRAYLDWMAGGCRAPGADKRWGLLRLFGLEHRLFRESARGEETELIAEAERLLGLYGDDQYIRLRYECFLETAAILVRTGDRRNTLTRDSVRGNSLETRIRLGSIVAAGSPLDADDVLLWLASLAGEECPFEDSLIRQELKVLWQLRFRSRYPSGFRVEPPNTRINISYRSASGTFEVRIRGRHEHLPDVIADPCALDDVLSLLASCLDELEAFERFVGRRPEARESLEAALLLPRALQRTTVIGALGRELHGLMQGKRKLVIGLKPLLVLAGVPVAGNGSVSSRAFHQLHRLLDAIGLAVEPDPRYGTRRPRVDSHVVLFRAPEGGPIDATQGRADPLRPVIEVATHASVMRDAAKDGETSIVRFIRSQTLPNSLKRARLLAYAVALHHTPVRPRPAKLKALPHPERMRIGSAFVAAALTDGQATAPDMAMLQALFRAMALPMPLLHSAIHRCSLAGWSRPTDTVRKPLTASAEVTGRLLLDLTHVARLKQDTAQIVDLFSDEADEEPVDIPQPSVSALSSEPEICFFEGLDARHGRLLDALVQISPLPCHDFAVRAAMLGLLPEAAVDVINEWGLDRVDELLLEGADSIAIAPHLLGPLSAFREPVT